MHKRNEKGAFMNELATAAKREYMKQWRKKNRDKQKANQERYWLKKAAEMGLTENKQRQQQ